MWRRWWRISERPAVDPTRGHERRMALLALAVQKPEAPGTCPPAEELAAFSEGRLDPAKRTALLEHLDQCASCYQQWLAVSAMQEALVPTSTQATALRSPSPVKRYWYYGIPATATALAFSLILLLWGPGLWLLGPGARLDDAYRIVSTEGDLPGSDELRDGLRLPWERMAATYGFAPISRAAPPYRAFGAGLWTGRERLAGVAVVTALPSFLAVPPDGADTWLATPWEAYFRLGEWSLLLRAVCEWAPDAPERFWSHQVEILTQTKENLSAAPNQKHTTAVDEILERTRALLQASRSSTNRIGLCRQVNVELNRLEERLAPTQPAIRPETQRILGHER